MRYIIYGAGAVGGVIGARLFEHGHDVVLIARGPHLDAIRERGLTFETPLDKKMLSITAVGHPSELRFATDDVVLMTMKTQDTEAALEDLRAAAGSEIPVVCAQNGVENERMAVRRFERVYAMLVFLPATHLDPGVVQAHAAPVSGVLDAGRYPTGTDSVIETVTADINSSGFSAKAVGDAMRWKYAKLLGNLGNALGTACGSAARAGPVYQQLREEAIACYKAAGIDWAGDGEMAARRNPMSPLGEIAGSHRSGSSSWQSLARGAGSIETDYLNGEITMLGRLHGVPTPANTAMQQLASRMLRDSIPPGSIDEVESTIAASATPA